MRVSCTSALRYGGNDENILRKMYEVGLAGQCDYLPAGDYRLTIRNVVIFYSEEVITAVAKTITAAFAKQTHFKVIDFFCDKTGQFSFAVRWAGEYAGNLVKGEALQNGYYKIAVTKESYLVSEHTMLIADEIHKALVDMVRASNIQWYENNVSGNGVSKPTLV